MATVLKSIGSSPDHGLSLTTRAVAQPTRTPYAIITGAMVVLYAVVGLPAWADGARPPIDLVLATTLAVSLIALSVIDLTTLRLPNVLTAILCLAGLVLQPSSDVGWRVVASAVAGGALWSVALAYRAIRGRDGLGFGDVKLFAACGAWVGLAGLSSVMLVACAAAFTVIASKRFVAQSVDRHGRMAFGPSLAFGLWIVWLYGPLDQALML